MCHRATGHILATQAAVRKQNRILKIPRTQAHPHPSTFEIGNQFVQAGLGFLFHHCGCFDGADGGLGLLLSGVRERMYVVEDVC